MTTSPIITGATVRQGYAVCGRAPSGQALAVPATPADAVDGPAGFDPSRLAWQEMATAPRDGTILVVYFYPWNVKTNPPRVHLVQWCDDTGHFVAAGDPSTEPYAEGWLDLEDFAAAIATEARRAETTGSACEGAGPKDIAQ